MALVLGALAIEWLGSAIAAAAAEGAAAAAAATAEATAAAAAEAAVTAEAAAAEVAATATAASEASAAEAAAAEAAMLESEAGVGAMVESEAGVEATIEADAEEIEAADKAAEAEVGLGARIGAELVARIETGLKWALELLKWLAKQVGEFLLIQMAIDQIPTAYRKVLASWAMMIAAGAVKLALVAFKYTGLSGGSKEGRKIAKQAQQIIDELHQKARKYAEDSPSKNKVPIDKETHAPTMEQLKQQVESDKKDTDKVIDDLDQINDLLKEHETIKQEVDSDKRDMEKMKNILDEMNNLTKEHEGQQNK